MKKKSIYNPCPICKLPRGKGKYEFVHGNCMEERAKTDGKKIAFPENKQLNKLTVENVEKAQRKNAAKRYVSGKLPSWMFD